MAARSGALRVSSLKQNLIITVHSLATGPLLGMALLWGLCTVAASCGYPFLRFPLGGEPRLVLSCGGRRCFLTAQLWLLAVAWRMDSAVSQA